LKKRLSKEEMAKLYVVSQEGKMFCTRAKLETTVRTFMEALVRNQEYLQFEEVDKFMKHSAFALHWDNEEETTKE
jgi:predicted flavoprotein YhiN